MAFTIMTARDTYPPVAGMRGGFTGDTVRPVDFLYSIVGQPEMYRTNRTDLMTDPAFFTQISEDRGLVPD
jgi:hypothetical protein